MKKICALCGSIAEEDPIVGCPRCKWDEMRDLLTHEEENEILKHYIGYRFDLKDSTDVRPGWKTRKFDSTNKVMRISESFENVTNHPAPGKVLVIHQMWIYATGPTN